MPASVKTEAKLANRQSVLSVPIDVLTMEQALARIDALIHEREPRLVVTADASALMIAQEDPAFAKLLENAALVTPDGAGVVWALRRQGVRVPGRVSGVDLVDKICSRSADRGYRIFLLGAEPGVAELAAERLRLSHPGCNVVGTRHGFFPAESDELVAKEIAPFKPDVLFVAMGMPRQEQFISATMNIIRAPVGIGVGGSLDVLSGRAKRAPRWIQRLALEWLYRLIQDPKKFRKVKVLPAFVWRVMRSKP